MLNEHREQLGRESPQQDEEGAVKPMAAPEMAVEVCETGLPFATATDAGVGMAIADSAVNQTAAVGATETSHPAAGASGEEGTTIMCGMGFDEAAARAALERNQWNLAAAVEDCVANSTAEGLDAAPGEEIETAAARKGKEQVEGKELQLQNPTVSHLKQLLRDRGFDEAELSRCSEKKDLQELLETYPAKNEAVVR